MNERKKIAFIHRYGLEGWICCGGHAVPNMVDQLLDKDVEVHFWGPETSEPKDPVLRDKLHLHLLPWTFDRANAGHKWSKTFKFYMALPNIGKKCRALGIDFIYWEETLPLGVWVLQKFYGPNIGIMVMDFFMRIYTERQPWLHWLRNLVEKIDCASWRKLPIVFTHVQFAKQYLMERGLKSERIHVVPNPCDHSKFHPINADTRGVTRQKFGFTESDLVLSHHGILHPNKGNDWILHRTAELKDTLPQLKYLLLGNGPEMANLKCVAEKLGVADRVVFSGWLDTEKEMNEALASADIGLVMRIGQETDHFHMTDTLNHEMACGKAIMAVHLAGIAEFITDGGNGFLFEPSQPTEFNEKLITLANDPARRAAFGAHALALSKSTCDLETCARKFVKPILHIASPSGNPAS